MTRKMLGDTLLFAVGCFMALAPLFLTAGCTQGPRAIPPATQALGGRITLAWDPAPDAASYNVYFSVTPGVTRQNGIRIANAANPITIRDLQRGTVYYFVVTAVSASGVESATSAEVSHAAE